jgi:hypothetical protein
MRSHRWLAPLVVALSASCDYGGAPDEVLFGEAVLTQPATGRDFKPLATYYLDPTVKVMGDTLIATEQPMPDAVRSAIDANMARLGYTAAPLSGAGKADVGLKMSLLRGTADVYYPGYWCDYWSYYGCYYDWTYAGSYNFGTAILEMGDLSAPDGTRLPILWLSAVYGVATSATLDVSRAVDGLNRAFAQSPYLDTH